MKRKKATLLILFSLLILWLVIPRFSRKWDIVENEELLKQKKNYLSNVARGKEAPNIIIIMADDLGRNDLRLYDEVNGIKTPHIEALAQSGVTFTDASASSPVCAPSRAGMLTGRVQNRYGFDSQPMQIYPTFPLLYYGFKFFVDTDEMHQVPMGTFPTHDEMKKQGVPQGELFLQEIMKSCDYETALIGKWHLGYGEEQHPLNRGFDNFYGFLEAFTYYADPSDEDVVSYRHDLFWENHIWSKKRRGPSAIQKGNEIINETRHLTDAVTEESLDFIKDHLTHSPDRPFFLLAAYSAPHTPFQELKKYYDMFPYISDENRRVYAAMIKHLDEGIGELLQGLEEMGLRDETLIIFASDNGGASYTLATENGDLAGGKLSQFEGGLEIPFLLSWPGKVPGAQIFRDPVSLLDVYSTVLESSKIPLPGDRILDSVNLIPHVLEEGLEKPHDVLFWKSGFNVSLRRGDWKLMLNTDTREYELFNLAHDRGEKTDVSSLYPEIAASLLKEALQWEGDCKKPLWPRVMNFEIEVNGKTYLFAT